MRDGLDDFVSGQTVVEAALDVYRQLFQAIKCHQGGYGDQTAVTLGELGTLPNIAEENLIVEFDKLGCEVTDQRTAKAPPSLPNSWLTSLRVPNPR